MCNLGHLQLKVSQIKHALKEKKWIQYIKLKIKQKKLFLPVFDYNIKPISQTIREVNIKPITQRI